MLFLKRLQGSKRLSPRLSARGSAPVVWTFQKEGSCPSFCYSIASVGTFSQRKWGEGRASEASVKRGWPRPAGAEATFRQLSLSIPFLSQFSVHFEEEMLCLVQRYQVQGSHSSSARRCSGHRPACGRALLTLSSWVWGRAVDTCALGPDPSAMVHSDFSGGCLLLALTSFSRAALC